MSEASRFLRWAVPGWVAILSWMGFIIADIVSTYITPGNENNPKAFMFQTISDFLRYINNTDTIANPVLLGLAGIPLGFAIYQMYFFVRWNSPFSKRGIFPPFIEGRMNDVRDVFRGISDEQKTNHGIPWRVDWLSRDVNKVDHTYLWQYFESLLSEVMQKLDHRYAAGFKLYERHRYLSDMLHTLGASLLGVYVGFAGYLILKFRSQNIPITYYALTVFLAVFALLFFMDYEDRNHKRKLGVLSRDEVEIIKNPVFRRVLTFFYRWVSVPYPSVMFGVITGMLIFFVSPRILANTVSNPLDPHYLWRYVLVLPAAFLWSKSAENQKESTWIFVISFFTVVLCITVRMFREEYFGWIDWSFTGPLFIFMMANLVLTKNRQNTRDDLIAFQNLTLKRWFNEEQSQAATGWKKKDNLFE